MDPSAPCEHMMDNRAGNLGRQPGSLGGPLDASALFVSVVVETLCGCGDRDHRYNLWDKK